MAFQVNYPETWLETCSKCHSFQSSYKVELLAGKLKMSFCVFFFPSLFLFGQVVFPAHD